MDLSIFRVLLLLYLCTLGYTVVYQCYLNSIWFSDVEYRPFSSHEGNTIHLVTLIVSYRNSMGHSGVNYASTNVRRFRLTPLNLRTTYYSLVGT
ncbi:hypothetical protein F4809DRAFT_633260 [Biscogniauxia mediterranea]|nr:hypothetical protein F4809DRAFT_633260 [Biscogniauxia mediterranea]